MNQISNREIKLIRSLETKKGRDSNGLFVVEGEKMVREAIDSRFDVLEVYRRDEIGEEAMSRISLLASPSPALALVRTPDWLEEAPRKFPAGLYLALDSIRDPGNLGTILRIADWFGVRMVLASRDTVDVLNPKVVQSTMGAIFRVDLRYVDLPEVTAVALSQKAAVYGTFLDGSDMYSRTLDPGADRPSIIVIGNESNGISEAMSTLVTDRLFIPPYPADQPGSESLNAAVATAITVAEFRRRLNSIRH